MRRSPFRNALALFALLSLVVFMVIQVGGAACPTTKTAWCGTDNNGLYVEVPVTWTQPAGCTGTFKITVTVRQSGSYAMWVHDNTTNQDILQTVWFSTSRDCSNGPTVSLTPGHSYTLNCFQPLGGNGAANVTFAECKIFIDCNGN